MKQASAKKGFTLAEVLIVLGVIGIVAALTIPTLLKNWQEERWKTASKVFENRLTEAVGQMHARGRLTVYTTTEAFVDELKNFMRMIEVCQNDNLSSCFVSEVLDDITPISTNTLSTAQSFSKSWGTNIIGLKLANGANVFIAYNPSCTLDPAATGEEVSKCSVAALYDTNGDSSPNKLTKDVNLFNAELSSFKCEGTLLPEGICVGDSVGGCINTCDGSEFISYDPSGSGMVFCSRNCWAGVKKACADKGMRLPTSAELLIMTQHDDILHLAPYNWASEENSPNYFANILNYGTIGRMYKDIGYGARCVKTP